MVTEVPGYVLRESIGTGSTATVWRGEAIGAPGRIVAIKVVSHEQGRDATDALRRDGETLGRLSHPSILQVVAVLPTDAGLALVTPYASGGSLASRLGHLRGGLPAEVVADLGARLASALAAMHGAGIVHGDVKPANVLFDRERQPLLGDAGIAALHGDVAAITSSSGYLDPELFHGRGRDGRSDLYALGVTLYEALAGVPPYAGTTTAQTLAAAERGRFVPLAEHVEAPPALTAAIEAAFARHVRDRPAGAHELAGTLDEIQRSMDSGASAPEPTSSSGRAGVLGAVPRPSRGATPSAPELSPMRSDDGRSATVGRDTEAPPPATGRRPTSRRLPRALLVATAIAVVLVPAGLAIASIVGDRATDAAARAEADAADAAADEAAADEAANAADRESNDDADGTTAREAAPLCAGLQTPDDEREILPADIEGVGCSAVVAWDGQRMEVLGADGPAEHYDLGARPGDVLLFGDWGCDGRDAPALYRPTDGQLFTFEVIAGPGERATATGTPTGVIDGVPAVVTDTAGCDLMEVAPP